MESLFSTDGLLIGTLLPFLFVLTVVVFVHEMGHYLIGRWCGIGVEAFSVGFGPELLGFTDGHGTRWKLSAIPLGGYVKFVGDVGATSVPDSEELEKLSAEQRKIAFHTQARWKKAATIFAGPAFNFLLTIAIIAFFIGVWGKTVFDPVAVDVLPGSAAEEAGIKPKDRFLAVNGVAIEDFDDMQRQILPNEGQKLRLTIERDGKILEVDVVPRMMEQTDPLGNKFKSAVIGVGSDTARGNPRKVAFGPLEAVGEATKDTWHNTVQLLSFLKRMVSGREDRCQLGGPVKIAKMSGQAAKQGIDWLVQLIATLSLGIGIINLLPILPLDGGHLLNYAIETVTRRPVPGWLIEWMYRIGFFAVLMLMGFVFWNDLVAC
jgi:regulator of sigma E protease